MAVESTMSVNRTVARTLSKASCSSRIEAMNAPVSRRIAGARPYQWGQLSWSGGGVSSTFRAPAIRRSTKRPFAGSSSPLPVVEDRTSVGTWIDGRIARTSVRMYARNSATTEPGVIEARW